MAQVQIQLDESNRQKLVDLVRDTGKTLDQLVNEALERFVAVAAAEEDRKLEAWKDAARRLAGIWKDRDDLPDFAELRKSWDRGYLHQE